MAEPKSPFRRGVPTALTDTQPLEQQAAGTGSPFRREQPSAIEDIGRVAPRALRTGVELIPAGPAEASGMAPALVRWVIQNSPFIDDAERQQALQDYDATLKQQGTDQITSDFGLESVRENITDPILGKGQDVVPQTSAGGYAKTALEEAPSALLNPGSIYSKIAQWLGSSTLSETAGQTAQHLGAPPWLENTLRIAGGGTGGFAPSIINKSISPHPIPPKRQPHIQELRSRNIPMSAGQITGSKRLMMREDVAGGIPALEQQGDAFVTEAMREQGGFPPGTDTASREVMRTELNRMGIEFDRIQNLSDAPFTQNVQDELLRVAEDYMDETPNAVPFIETTMNNLGKNAAANGGMLSGVAYKDTRSKLNDIIRNTEDDGLRKAAMDMQDVLDTHIEQHLPPQEQSAWRTVRSQYRNYLPIEHAKSAGGGRSARGEISPLGLKAGVKAIEGKREIASGERGMTDLAESGAAILEEPRSSGTAERRRAQLSGLLPLLSGGGGLAAMLQAGLPGPLSAALATAGAAGAMAIPAARDQFIRSDFGQKMLARQGPQMGTERNLLASILGAAREKERQDREMRGPR